MKNIIFLTHNENNPSGGGKVIYRFSEIINNFKNFSSEIIHIKKKKFSKFQQSINKRLKIKNKKFSGWQLDEVTVAKNFSYDWFKNDIKIKENFDFNYKNDFIILPEIFAHFADELLIKNKIHYGIFVQNGYVINSTDDEIKLFKAYKNAKFILSISDNVTNCIRLKFPNLKNKIMKVMSSVDLGEINISGKINMITYMSRKLPNHSNLVTTYLKPYLSQKWKLQDLNNLTEEKTYEYLKKSKIFLSFSSLEGVGLPPIEAALAFNHVVGYTGEGGNEFWKGPLFNKINSGDINNFVLRTISLIKKNSLKHNSIKKSHFKLKKKFSRSNEIINIKRFLKKV